MENKKEELLKFIKRHNSKVESIISVKVKDYDDDNGMIGQHYIVECHIPFYEITESGHNHHARCLVDVSEFNAWLNKKEAIKWI